MSLEAREWRAGYIQRILDWSRPGDGSVFKKEGWDAAEAEFALGERPRTHDPEKNPYWNRPFDWTK